MSSNELEKLLFDIEELKGQIIASTDQAERTAMRNVLAAMLQNAAAMRQKEVQLTPGEQVLGAWSRSHSGPWPC